MLREPMKTNTTPSMFLFVNLSSTDALGRIMEEMMKVVLPLEEYLPIAEPEFQAPGPALHITVGFISLRLSPTGI